MTTISMTLDASSECRVAMGELINNLSGWNSSTLVIVQANYSNNCNIIFVFTSSRGVSSWPPLLWWPHSDSPLFVGHSPSPFVICSCHCPLLLSQNVYYCRRSEDCQLSSQLSTKRNDVLFSSSVYPTQYVCTQASCTRITRKVRFVFGVCVISLLSKDNNT